MVKDLVSIFGFDPLFGFDPTIWWNPSDQLLTLYGIHIAAVYALVRIHEHPGAKRFALFIVFAGWLLPTLVPMTTAVEYAFRDKSKQPPKPFLTEDEAPGGTPIERPPVLDEAAGLAMVFFHIASVFIACAHTFLFRPWNVPGFEAGKDKGRLLAARAMGVANVICTMVTNGLCRNEMAAYNLFCLLPWSLVRTINVLNTFTESMPTDAVGKSEESDKPEDLAALVKGKDGKALRQRKK